MARPERIDAHQHFWRLARGDYGWITERLAPIRRDFGPDDLAPALARHGIAGTVVVQAAPTVAETAFLLQLAAESPMVRGVVGWVDLAAPDARAAIARLARDPLLKGVRPMLQDIPDTRWIARPDVVESLRALAGCGLRLDALVTPRHLDVLAEVAEAVPDLPIVIDHCAKPIIAGGADPGSAWRNGMARLAALPQVMCKISGLATEAGPGWDAAALAPVARHVLACFGPDRAMWGSDWPVLTLAGDYDAWWRASEILLGPLDDDARDAVLGGTASAFYGLDARR